MSDTLNNESVPIEGDLSSTGVIDGDVVLNQPDLEGEIQGLNELDGEISAPKEYRDKAFINEVEVTGHKSSATDYGIEVLKEALSVTKTVGGCYAGTEYEKNEMLETIIRDMLNPLENPTLVPPSASLSATGPKLLEKGDELNTVVTVSFNRGQINPAYGTSGYRSGPATAYSLNGSEEQEGNSFFYTVVEGDDELKAIVRYSEGEQPKNSAGEDYAEPLPAGTVESSILTYEFVNALWANTSDILTVTKQALVSKLAKVKEFLFPEQTAVNPEIFDVPSTWTITAIEVLNTLSNQWENCSHEFTTSTTEHNDASGTLVTYTRYTDNRGYSAGSRTIRIKWN